jgi:ABC-type dipeptide/oligopeptide/nickel transport system permease subunit
VLGARARARFVKSRSGIVGGAIVAGLIAFALIGPVLVTHDPLRSDFSEGVSQDGTPVGPNGVFLLGTDRLFRDVLARLAYAARLSLLISFAATAIATCIGSIVGVVAGWHEGGRARVPWPTVVGIGASVVAIGFGRPRLAAVVLGAGIVASLVGRFAGLLLNVDALLMRFVDVILAFPFLLLVMAIGAALDRASPMTIFVTLGTTSWLGIARVLRAKTMQVRSLEYILAARALGQSTERILFLHVLPNVAGPLLVSATMLVGQMMVADSVLSYLGVGISPPTPTWGRMLFEGQDSYVVAPWLVAAPGTAILLAVWGFNMLGEGLRDALDPHEA